MNGTSLRPKLYVAAPLFSLAELSYNKELKSMLAVSFEVYLPQEDGELLIDTSKKFPLSVAQRRIFEADLRAIRAADALLIVLDGRVVDEGAAFELGFAYAANKVCVGLQTDPRRLLSLGNNPMIACALMRVFEDHMALQNWAIGFADDFRGRGFRSQKISAATLDEQS